MSIVVLMDVWPSRTWIVFGCTPSLNLDGRVRVPEVVGVTGEADGCLDRLRPRPGPEMVRPQGAATLASEDERPRILPGAGDERRHVRGQLVDDGGGYGDGAPSGLRLRRPKLDVSLGLGQRLLYRQDPAGKVHMPDPQGCQLADTQLRVGGGEHERPIAGWHRIRQGEDLFFGQEAHGEGCRSAGPDRKEVGCDRRLHYG